MMTRKKLDKLRLEVESLRRGSGNVRSRELVSLAGKVGRLPQNRGKEPTYECLERPDWVPLTIPQHPGQMAKKTVLCILNQLESDIDSLDQELGEFDAGDEPETD